MKKNQRKKPSKKRLKSLSLLLKKEGKSQKDNYRSFKESGYATFICLGLITLLSIFQTVDGQSFTSGNLAVFVAAASSSNTTGSIVEINTTTAGQAAITTHLIDGVTTPNELRFSGSASSTCYMSNSNDGTLLCFTGVNTTNTGSNLNTIGTRGVGTYNNAGTFSLATTYTAGTSGGTQARGASTLNNSTWYIGDQDGFYTNGSSTRSPSGNFRSVKAFGGVVYAFTASATLAPVGTISAATGGTYTALPGLGSGSTNRQDFYMISSGANGNTFDVLYVLSASGASADSIFKYSLVSGSWTGNGFYIGTTGGFGLAAKRNGSGADLFLSTGTGATTANSVVKLNDANGYNQTISITVGNTLYTAAAGTIVKGVAFAPVPCPSYTAALSGDAAICNGSSTNLSVTITGGFSPFTVIYSDGSSNFTVNSYTSGSNISVSPASTKTYSLASVTSIGGCVATSLSGTPTVTVNSGSTSAVLSGATTICNGGSTNLSVAITGGTSPYSVVYSDGNSNFTVNSYTSGSNISVSPTSTKTYSLASVTSTGGCAGTGLSGTPTVTVNSIVAPSVSIEASPGNTICSGTNVTFTATPTNGGSSPYYQWKLNNTDVGDGSNTYTNNSLADGDTVTCILTSNAVCLSTTTATSNTITIHVTTSVTPSVAISSDTGTTICSSINVTFTATPVNGGNTPSYQWKLNGNNVGGNSATYSNNSLADHDTVICVLTSSNACASPSTATSNSIGMTVTPTVTPLVSIAAVPDNTICAGTSVTFTVTPVNGGAPSYQWANNNINVGTNSATYSSSSLANHDTIACIMTSTANCRTSNTAVSSNIIMTVNPLPIPSITGTLSFCSGDSTQLDAGAGYASYLWSTGATTQTIYATTGGSYSVTVSDGTCSGTSSPVTVIVLSVPNQPDNFTVSSANVNTGQIDVVYTVPNDTAVTYTWNYSGTGATINGSSNSVTVDFSSSATSGNLSVTAHNNCGASPARSIAVTVTQTNFTTGRLVVVKTTGAVSKGGSPVILNEYATDGTPGISVALPSTGSTPIQMAAGSGGSEGFLTKSADGSFLTLAGYSTSTIGITDITATTASSTPRIISKVDAAGIYTQVGLSTTDYNANDIRGSISDGVNYWASGASVANVDGIDYYGPGTPVALGTGATPIKAYGLHIFNGQIYYSTQKAGPSNTVSHLGIFSLGSGLPTSGSPTSTQIIDVGATNVPADFSFNPTLDICYIAINLNTAAGGIQKWTKSGSTWSLAYTLGTGATNIGAYGLVVDYTGANPVIYATTFESNTVGNRIITITDTGAGSAVTTLITGTANTWFHGIAFAPASVACIPVSITTQPTSPAAVCSGSGIATFTVAVNGTGPFAYQWQENSSNISDNAVYSGTNSSTLTITNPYIALNGKTYRCVITNCGSSNIVTTDNTATLTVNPSIVITASAIPDTICSGEHSTLSASGADSYTWQPGNLSGASVIVSPTVTTTYTVTGTSTGSCPNATSTVTVIVNTPQQPTFTTNSDAVNPGQTGVVYTVANDSSVTYTWHYSGLGATINGTGNSITIDFSPIATSGNLSITATNYCGASLARNLFVTVMDPSQGNIRITEYMYSGTNGEYVEFTNVSSTPVDMTGWSFDDNTRIPGSQNLSFFGIVQPGEAVIMTEAIADTFRAAWGLCPTVKVIGENVNNLSRADEINLYNANTNLVDRLTYDDQTLGGPRTQDKSAWVSPAGLGINKSNLWTASTVADSEDSYTSSGGDVGSPGKSTLATVSFDPCAVTAGSSTIVIDVASTTNFLDGGATTSTPSPYGISGVISDPTDPARTLGIDLTIGDSLFPVNSLTVTVTSGNTSVVPLANLNLTGSGASRNLKITPAAIGYSNITLTVHNGTDSTSYVIIYAASVQSSTPNSTLWHTGTSDASDGIPLDNNYYVTGDDELNVLSVYSRSASGLPVAQFNYTPFIDSPDPHKPEVDVEAATRSTAYPDRVYWTGSMSNSGDDFHDTPARDRLFATSVTGTGASTSFSVVGYAILRDRLIAWGDEHGYDFTSSAAEGINPKLIYGFDVEGMVLGPDNTTLYIAMRAPLVPISTRDKAVIIPLLNFESWFNNGSQSGDPTFGEPIELDLGARGIRDIIRLSNGTYIISTGDPAADDSRSALFKWTGYASDAPVLINSSANGALNMEGVMEVNDSTEQLSLTNLQVINDGGSTILYTDLAEAKQLSVHNHRKFRSDFLTGLDLDICSGFAATITASGSTTLCTGDSVLLSAPAANNNSYLWSTGETSQSIYAHSSTQNYSVTVTSTTSGCSASSSIVTVTNALPSDFNGDHITDEQDFLLLLGIFNSSCTCPEDFNNDGIVNNVDFLILLGQYNQTCQ